MRSIAVSRIPILAMLLLAAAIASIPQPAAAQQPAIACAAPLTPDRLPDPEPREDPRARRRFDNIRAQVRAHAWRILFLGDSLTQRWEAAGASSWQRYFAPLDALNAGVDGDRTEHLLWRLRNGQLDGQSPNIVVLLIGTNDLGHGRAPDFAAEGIRANLLELRQRLPQARILLEGLWPRIDLPRLGQEVDQVNALIKTCDGGTISYADIGRALADPQGRVTREVEPDGLHLSAVGYERVSQRIRAHIDRILRD